MPTASATPVQSPTQWGRRVSAAALLLIERNWKSRAASLFYFWKRRVSVTALFTLYSFCNCRQRLHHAGGGSPAHSEGAGKCGHPPSHTNRHFIFCRQGAVDGKGTAVVHTVINFPTYLYIRGNFLKEKCALLPVNPEWILMGCVSLPSLKLPFLLKETGRGVSSAMNEQSLLVESSKKSKFFQKGKSTSDRSGSR